MNPFSSLLKLLAFEITRDDLLQFHRGHLLLGLIGTWLVGMGRYWDDPQANWMQHLGLGSVIYIFVLALFIWIILWPFKIKNWNYFTVVTFISLTSFPAIFYAIPVERFLTIDSANTINVWFLAIVAAWRLGLLFHFLKQFTQLNRGAIITVTLMPICVIISILTLLNLHRVVFNIMGGVRTATAHDSSYTVLMILTGLSLLLSLPLIVAYVYYVFEHRRNSKSKP